MGVHSPPKNLDAAAERGNSAKPNVAVAGLIALTAPRRTPSADSAALVLRDACAAEDYQAVKDVVGVYIGIGGPDFAPPFQWREDITELAREYRAKAAEKTEV
jgi:hypothetical protein